ncbi:1-deoxy-D-xylulose-5-phosphate reductoisomerase [Entomobacter blattae]|uniref:1-deoxy-D-xylulose 5-phosphate reductoisomerase n=1 Tax=Entomobacter blattae TaxID=2762277 RepID=A0A7H1NSK9_9PROT|nr:1-deoxy-D-xylulose-5-phosphate reductoisomerase [Entomobacter blattae]QNT78769.1 1-deoxy-D-xylulose 5-phosphate reductoisomerase [Entomobacter blattae]
MKTVTVLGSTGSIGCSTVNLLEQALDQFQVKVLVGGSNVEKLAEQAISLRAEHAVIADESQYDKLKTLLSGMGIKVSAGRSAVIEAAHIKVDWTMAAITGAAGLEPILSAVKNGGTIALANKEALVCAGDVMLKALKKANALLLPVDSEHNAVFQAMADKQIDQIKHITLTASGGPFRQMSLKEMKTVTVTAALKHPTWTMGAKITIDSATMFNKGLEIIEASRIFSLPEDKIKVLVHPQSVVHGMVHYTDGSFVAQLGSADMRIPIAHTLAWPKRMATNVSELDLAQLALLNFEAPDEERFPAMCLAREALRQGGCVPAVLSAANEIAVDAFLKGRIGFLEIAGVVEKVMGQIGTQPAETLEEVLFWDKRARELTQEHLGVEVT